MQLPSESLSVVVAIITSFISSAVTYGAMRARVDRLEKDIDKVVLGFVPAEVFRTHITKIEFDLTELKKDMRLLLNHLVNKSHRNESRDND